MQKAAAHRIDRLEVGHHTVAAVREGVVRRKVENSIDCEEYMAVADNVAVVRTPVRVVGMADFALAAGTETAITLCMGVAAGLAGVVAEVGCSPTATAHMGIAESLRTHREQE